MAGQAGFEPATRGFGDRRSTVRATALGNGGIPYPFSSLAVACRPWSSHGVSCNVFVYLVSLCKVCLRHHRQYFLTSSFSGVFRLSRVL